VQLEQQLAQASRLEAIGRLTAASRTTSTTCSPSSSAAASCCRKRWRSDAELGELARTAWPPRTGGAELTSQLLAFSRRQPLDPRPST
jgi:hypothetical protein